MTEQNKHPILSKIVGIVCLCILAYAFFNSIVGDILIRKHGRCTKAIIYRETLGVKTKSSLGYKFFTNGEEYKGLTPVDGILKIGDSICVVYFESLPGMNRPLSYFDAGKINCDCKN
jgi:hypothetical protein